MQLLGLLGLLQDRDRFQQQLVQLVVLQIVAVLAVHDTVSLGSCEREDRPKGVLRGVLPTPFFEKSGRIQTTHSSGLVNKRQEGLRDNDGFGKLDHWFPGRKGSGQPALPISPGGARRSES